MTIEFWGHSKNDGGSGVPEPLGDHVRAVAESASKFARTFGGDESANAAGWLHDLGKFADQMQRRLRGNDPRGRDHWTAGVIVAIELYKKLGNQVAAPIAASIAGHHVGLSTYWADPSAAAQSLAKAMLESPDDYTESNIGLLMNRHQSAGFPIPKIKSPFTVHSSASGSLLDTRMLFSTLVDADFLETEAHFEGTAEIPRRYRDVLPCLPFENALRRVETYVRSLDCSQSDPDLKRMREQLFETCLHAGRTLGPGVYTLAAPTGAGKTLAMLAFALGQAANPANSISRVILSMPFLNIIDQTAAEYRKLFAHEFGFNAAAILEDHSTAEASDQSAETDDNSPTEAVSRIRRLCAENWDASLIMTTNVKLLESLHANRPARCRKLHRLANSVILFDEVQTIPPKLVKPTLATLAHLAHRYGSTIVFATATQPAFDHLSESVFQLSKHHWSPNPIVKNSDWMFEIASRRITVDWRIDEATTWESLASELLRNDARQVVCIVNLKRHAQQLIQLLRNNERPGLRHISTNMCQLHRTEVLRQVAKDLSLKSDAPLCLVSTQCIEAGVNLDSPVMYRALAPLESISQAAGRCNRHGLRAERGRVVVFKPKDDGSTQYPPGGYESAAVSTETFLRGLRTQGVSLNDTNILNNPGLIRRYYQQFYSLNTSAISHPELHNATETGDFAKVAEKYKLITGDQINIVVPYQPEAAATLSQRIRDADRGPGFIRKWIHDARPHSVSIHRPKQTDNIWCYLEPCQFNRRQLVDNATADWFLLLDESIYDPTLGLKTIIEFATSI